MFDVSNETSITATVTPLPSKPAVCISSATVRSLQEKLKMAFRVFLYEEAAERLQSYTAEERQCVYENLDRLAEAPVKLSRRSAPPASLPMLRLMDLGVPVRSPAHFQ